MRYTIFNPFRRVMNETRHFAHTRTLRTSFRTKIFDALEVFWGNNEYALDNCVHFGIFDYMTLFVPGLITYFSIKLWNWSNKESGILPALGIVFSLLLAPLTIPLLAMRLLSGLFVIALATPIIYAVDRVAKVFAKERLTRIAAVSYYPKPEYDNQATSPHFYTTDTGEVLQNNKKIVNNSSFWEVPYPQQRKGTLADQNLDELSIDIMREPHVSVFDQSFAFSLFKAANTSYGLALRVFNTNTRAVVGIIPIIPENKQNIEALLALNVGDITRRLELRSVVFAHIQGGYDQSDLKSVGDKITTYDFIFDLMNGKYKSRPDDVVTAQTNGAIRSSNTPHSWEHESLRWCDEANLKP